MPLKLANGGTLDLYEVLFVPTLTKNLMSTLALGRLKQYRIIMEDDLTKIALKQMP